MNLSDYYDLLEKHDWFYSYSDDHRVWSAGNESMNNLVKLGEHYGDSFTSLRSAYASHIFNGTDKPPRPTGEG